MTGISPILMMEYAAILATERKATLMTGIVIHKLTAPSAWAPYLVNGDASGLEDSELQACDSWIQRQGIGSPIDCVDAGFRRTHDALAEFDYGADCQRYTFLTRAESPHRLNPPFIKPKLP